MNLTPTGIVRPTPDGRDLVLVRTFQAPIDDVWASITEPERVGRWFGTWTGEAAVGVTLDFVMTAEEGNPTTAMTVTACDPPHLVGVSAVDEYGSWNLEARLSEAGGITTLEFVHHLDSGANVGEVGPGWEYYLDRLVASRSGDALPDFDAYYPAMQAHFEQQ